MRSFTEKTDTVITAGTSTQELHKSYPSKMSTCKNCNAKGMCRRRSFSEQAWTVLLLWNEINPGCVDQAICSQCYEELREILIDRADEIEMAMTQTEEVDRIRKSLTNIVG